MSTATDTKTRMDLQGAKMTVEEFLALPDDGIHRELIRGIVREYHEDFEDHPRGPSMTVRNRVHSRIMIRIGQLLNNWMDEQPEPRGEVVGGEAGFRLEGTDESLVGIDVAVFSAAMIARTDLKQKIYDGAPVLAVEVLSPNDTHADIAEVVMCYIEAGTVVWIVDPDLETVTVYQPGRETQVFSGRQEIVGETYLPGFKVDVARFFK